MKKNLVLAIVAMMAVAPAANAASGKGGGREAKPEGALGREVREAKQGAATEARTGADSGKSAQALVKAAEAAKLTTRLNPNERSELGQAVTKNPALKSALEGAIEQAKNPALRDLAEARVRALSFLKDVKTDVTSDAIATLSENARIEQAYLNLAIKAGKSAESWSPELRENLTFLLAKANDILASGNRSIAEAMKEANTVLAKSKEEGGRSVRLDLNEVNQHCK